MFIYAGKTYSARYDKRAPIHIAIADPDVIGEGAKSLCHSMVVSPITDKGSVEITCRACQSRVGQLQELLEV